MDFPKNNNCGCISNATKRFNKTAAKKDIRFKKSTTIQVWSINKFLAICIIMIHIMPLIYNNNKVDAAPISAELSSSLTDDSKTSIESLIPKGRVRKHSRSSEMSHPLDWENPCGGRYEKRVNPISGKRKSIDYHFRYLRKSINDFRNHGLSIQAINISDIHEWFGHNKTYKFLARVKPQSNINLTRWHRNMQVYVASFSYFRRKQRIIYQKKSTITNGKFSKELDQLFVSARGILCSIESTINSTQTNHKIQTIPRDEMKRRLKYRTKNRHSIDNEIDELDDIDLKFLKVRYYETTSGMIRTINRGIRENKCNKTNLLHNLSNNSNNNLSDNSMSSNSLYNSQSNSGSTESNEKIMKMCQRLRRRRKLERSRTINNQNSQHQSGSSSVI